MNKKPTPEDLKIWKEFISNKKEIIEDKDRDLDQEKKFVQKEVYSSIENHTKL